MDSPHSWLSVVGLNLARSWWRRRYAEQRANRRSRALTTTAPPAEPADVLTVRAAVAQLPHRQRSALLFRFYAGMSVVETAAAMHCAEGTVKSLTHRAMAALREMLSDLAPTLEEPVDPLEPVEPVEAVPPDEAAVAEVVIHLA
jgi:RNA polymerase sigma factor (sigma-70 family)